MNRPLFAIVVSVGLFLSSVASAYQVDISFWTESFGGGASSHRLYVSNNGSVGVGAINLFVTGPNTLTLNPAITSLSAPDSVLTINPLDDGQNFLILNNVTIPSGSSIVNAGAQEVWLADLSGPSFLTFAQGAEFVNGSSTVFDTFFNPIPNVGIYVNGHLTYEYVAPEPATTALLALGLAAFGLARRALE